MVSRDTLDCQELTLLESFLAKKASVKPRYRKIVQQRYQDLQDLFAVYSHFPSIVERHHMSGKNCSIDTLIEVLLADGCNHLVLLPTKVALGRSFMIAKFNFFGFLRFLCIEHRELSSLEAGFRRLWETAMFSLLLEDVYQVIIERADRYTDQVRRQAADDLVHLWEFRFDNNVTTYAPILIELWQVRRDIAPVFGTMLGTIELLKLSSKLPERWHEFIMSRAIDQEVTQALEEFIFGLTRKEIITVRDEMQRNNMMVIDRDDVSSLLSSSFCDDAEEHIDPRHLYRFYQKRMARRPYAGSLGTNRTLEEILLVYLIEEKQRMHQQA